MKKLLALLGVVSLSVAGTSAVVACGPVDETIKDYGLNEDVVNVLSKIINDQINEDIKDKVDMNWTYSDLFGIDGSHDSSKFWDELLYDKLTDGLKEITNEEVEPKYSEEQIAELKLKTQDYIRDGLELAYINGDSKEKQEIFYSINKEQAKDDQGKDKTLEYVIFDEVNKQLKEEGKPEIETPDEIAKQYLFASLGFSFNNKGNVKLDLNGKNFWTFSFIAK